MTSQTPSVETYRQQLARWARALAAARQQELSGVRGEDAAPREVQMFVEDNVNKRLDKLRQQLEFVVEAFADFNELLLAFTRGFPLEAYATAASDGERFLDWLGRTQSLTAEQADYVACQRARHAVEDAARNNRWEHVRFQELWSLAGKLAEELGTNPALAVHLNPARAWSRFLTPALLDEGAEVPADVLFFAAGGDIRTAILEGAGRSLVLELACLGPCTLDQWAVLTKQADREELVDFCRDLARMGAIAFS
jgi:hypothetical protein